MSVVSLSGFTSQTSQTLYFSSLSLLVLSNRSPWFLKALLTLPGGIVLRHNVITSLSCFKPLTPILHHQRSSLNRYDKYILQNSWSAYGSQNTHSVSRLLVFAHSVPSAWNVLICVWLAHGFKTQFRYYLPSSFQLRGTPLSFKQTAPWTHVTCWSNLLALHYLFPLFCSPLLDSYLLEGKACFFSITDLQLLLHKQAPCCTHGGLSNWMC